MATTSVVDERRIRRILEEAVHRFNNELMNDAARMLQSRPHPAPATGRRDRSGDGGCGPLRPGAALRSILARLAFVGPTLFEISHQF
jgi:hypothetical protein